MIVADTDVLIDFLSGHEPGASRVAAELSSSSLATTAVSRFELLAGAMGSGTEASVRRLLDTVRTLPLEREAADRAAEVRRTLDRKGPGIGMADSLIAGIALVHDGALLTRNRKHFARVDGLRLAGF